MYVREKKSITLMILKKKRELELSTEHHIPVSWAREQLGYGNLGNGSL